VPPPFLLEIPCFHEDGRNLRATPGARGAQRQNRLTKDVRQHLLEMAEDGGGGWARNRKRSVPITGRGTQRGCGSCLAVEQQYGLSFSNSALW